MTNLASAASLRETVLSSVEKLSAKRSLVTWRTDAADDHDHYADDQKPPKNSVDGSLSFAPHLDQAAAPHGEERSLTSLSKRRLAKPDSQFWFPRRTVPLTLTLPIPLLE